MNMTANHAQAEPRFNLAGAPLVAQHRILFVEDDEQIANLIGTYLEKAGFDVDIESRGDKAVARILQEKPNLVLLDLMLPGKDGFAICRELRAANASIPIIILTAKEERFDEVLGLEMGADEYIIKPAEPRVLLARIRAVLRRSQSNSNTITNGEQLRFTNITIDRAARCVICGEQDVPVSAADFDLLWFLACNAGRVMSRDDILSALRGLNYDGVSRSVDTRVSRLRRRLAEACGNEDIIKTVRPRGYMFCLNIIM
jgi:DNA-binding response OmpR family regulator